MKIGIFTETYLPIINGVVTAITNYTRGFEELGHEVLIFCPTYKEKPTEKNVVYVPSEPFPGKSGYQYILPFNKKVFDLAKGLDIIHAHHPFMMGVKGLRLAKKLKKPFIFTNHTQYEKYLHYVPVLGPLFKKGINWWLSDFAKKCTLVTTPSEGMKNQLIKNGYPAKTTIAVPNGVEIDDFKKQVIDSEKQKIRQELKISNDDKVLIFTGRLAEEKNISFLIKAFAKINKKMSNTKLILIGGGSEEKNLKLLIKKLGIKNQVVFAGPIEHSLLHAYYQTGDLFVFPSKTETFGLVTIEAMASGLPAVAIKATGTDEIVVNGVNGFMTKENQKDFSDAAIKLLTNSKLYAKIKTSTPKTIEKFSIINASKLMLKAYERAIKIVAY